MYSVNDDGGNKTGKIKQMHRRWKFILLVKKKINIKKVKNRIVTPRMTAAEYTVVYYYRKPIYEYC
jgi:hypothetical protein